MFTILVWHNYYNEKEECWEFTAYRNTRSVAIVFARWHVEHHSDADRCIVYETGTKGKRFFEITKQDGHIR